MSATGRFQGVLEPSRTVGDVDVKAEAPKGCIASYPEVRLVGWLVSCADRVNGGGDMMVVVVIFVVGFFRCTVPYFVGLFDFRCFCAVSVSNKREIYVLCTLA